MYLDGQLPYGPKSDNPGAPAIPTFLTAAPEVTYAVPGGGPTVVSPTIANADGIVQPPLNSRKTAQFDALHRSTASYGNCGDYGANGSLETIANRAGRGMGDCCQSGPQTFVNNAAAPEDKGLALAVGILAVAILLGGQR